MLTCTKCKETKEATAVFFPLHNRKKNGLDSWCRSCRSSYRSNTRRGAYKTMLDNATLQNLIETTSECTICGEVDAKGLVVDHCHISNIVRGMLCNRCNMGLGLFRDDPFLLEFARIYVLSHTNNPEAEAYINANHSGVHAQSDRETWDA